MSTSLIYQSPFLYETLMKVLYGFAYADRYQAIADCIPAGSSLTDVCCGPATVYFKHLKAKGVRYTGVDINAGFIQRLKDNGAEGTCVDLLDAQSTLPQADTVLMHASLYHFLPDPKPVINKMLAAANHTVIIAEPIRNMADSDIPFIRWLAARMTNPGTSSQPTRFNEASFDALMSHYQDQIQESRLIAGGREKLFILRST